QSPAKVKAIPCINASCDARSAGLKSTDQFGVKLQFVDSTGSPISSFVKRNTADGYPRKQLYRVEKPTGNLILSLVDTTPGTELSGSNATPFPVRQGMTGVGNFTPSIIDFEASLTQNTTVDGDSFLIPPSSALYFQSPKVLQNQTLAGKLEQVNIGGTAIALLDVYSDPFEVVSGAPWQFKIVDHNNNDVAYQDYTGSKIVIQQVPITSALLGRAVEVWAIDKYNNLTRQPIPVKYKWIPSDPLASKCTDSSNVEVSNPFVTFTNPDGGSPGAANRLSNVTEVTPTSEQRYRIYLNSPCNIKGRLKIELPNANSFDQQFISMTTQANLYLPEVEFVGDVAHHFLVEAVLKPSDPNQEPTVRVAAGVDGTSGVTAGAAFYLRVIPLTQNGMNHAAAYADTNSAKKMNLRGVISQSWANTGTTVLPPPDALGQDYYCFFKQETMTPAYPNAALKNDVPVCLIKGPQVIRASCNTGETAIAAITSGVVCEQNSGFKVAATTTSSDNRVILIRDKTNGTTIIEDLAVNALKLNINAGAPSRILLANQCGGPANGARAWNELQSDLYRTLKSVDEYLDNSKVSENRKYYQVSVDDKITIVPSVVDDQGNWIKDMILPAGASGLSVTKSSESSSPYLTESGAQPSLLRETHAAGETATPLCTRSGYTRLVIQPTQASAQNALAVLGSNGSKDKFDTLTFASDDTAFGNYTTPVPLSVSLTLAVRPGRPAFAAVVTERVNLASASFDAVPHSSDTALSKNLSPGDCARIRVTARDSKNNLIYDNADSVTVDLQVKNYYSTGSNKQLFQPGGLFKKMGSETKLTPLTTATADYVPNPAQSTWTTFPSQFPPSSTFEPDQLISYVGHERIAGQIFTNGELSGLNRYFCVFDESAPAPGPSVSVTLRGGTTSAPYTISGDSTPFTMVALAASLVDIRDNQNKRLCPIPTGTGTGLMLPRRVKVGTAYNYVLDSVGTPATCNIIEVSSQPAGFKTFAIDAVGNLKSEFTVGTPSLSGSSYSIVSSCPTDSHWCIVSSGDTGLRKAGQIVATLSATSAATSIGREMRISALSKTPKEFVMYVSGQVGSSSPIVSADTPFQLIFQAKDEFGNFINDPNFSYTMTSALQYYTNGSLSSVSSTTGSAAAADSANSTGKAPATLLTPLQFNVSNSGLWEASTLAINSSGVFHFKNNINGPVTIKATVTYAKTGSASVTSSQVSLPVTILTGAVAKTVVTQDTSSTEITPPGADNSGINGLAARASTAPYYFRTKSFDQYENVFVSADPSANIITVSCSDATIAVCSAVSADPGRLQISVVKSGTFNLTAYRGNVQTVTYKFRIDAGSPSKVQIIAKPGTNFDPATQTLTAGDSRSFKIALTDDFGNIATSIGGTWSVSWSVAATYPDIPLGGEKVVFATPNGTCAFTSGECATDYLATFKGASLSNTDGKIVVQAVQGTTTLLGSLAIKTQPSALSFYNVKKASANSPEARRDNNSAAKFSVQVTSHDALGNYVSVPEAKNLKLQIVRSDGSKTFFPDGNDANRVGNGLIRWNASTNTALVSASTDTAAGQTRDANQTYTLATGSNLLAIENLAFDDPGDYKILATDQNNITTPLDKSEVISLAPTLNSLKEFYLDLPASLSMMAGQSSVIRVVARTYYNLPLRGLDKLLSNDETGKTYQFMWNTTSNAGQFTSTSERLPETNSSLPTTFTFVDGIASVPITFQQVGAVFPATDRNLTNAFLLKGKQTISGVETVHASTKPATSAVTLAPNALAKYTVAATGLAGSPTATLDSRFDLTVTAYDAYDNRRPGEAGLNVVAEKHSDTSKIGGSNPITPLRKPNGTGNKFADGFDASFSPNEINLSNGQWTATGLVYLVPQTVKFTLAGAAAGVTVTSTTNTNTTGGYIAFAPALGTVKSYTVSLVTGTTDLTTTGQYRTHGDTAVRVTALDIDGNAVTTIQSNLNGLTYTWAGANTLTSPSTETPVYPTTANFDATGTWQTNINFKATQSFLAGILTVTDNFTVSGANAFRTGGNSAPFTVYSRHKDYTVDAGGASVDWNVGTPSQVKITARGYDNLPVREYDTVLNGLTFAWSGSGFANSPNSAAPIFSDKTSSNSTKNNKQFAFNNGVAFANITAVKAESVAASNVTLTDSGAKSGNLTGTINVKSGALAKYVLTADQTSRNADSTSNGLFNITVKPLDGYENPTKGEASLALTATGGSKSKTSIKSTTAGFNAQQLDMSSGLDSATGFKTFANLYYDVPDTNIQFTLTGTALAAANVTSTANMTFNATERSIVGYNLSFQNGNAQTAGTAFTVTLTPRDIAGNILTSLASGLSDLQALRFKLSGPSNSLKGDIPQAAGADVTSSKNINPNFSTGLVGTVSVTLVRAEQLAAGAFVFEDNASTPRTGANAAAITVSGAAPNAIYSANLPAVKAAQQFDVTAYLKDQYLNTSFTGCGSTTANGLYAVIGWKNDAGNFSEAAADTTPSGVFTTTTGASPLIQNSANAAVTSSSTVGPESANGDQMKLKITLYKKGQNRVRLLACGGKELALTVDVSEAAAAAKLLLNTSATRPTTTTAMTEMECRHSGSDLTSSQVICPTVYSYFWDTYGNTYGDGTTQCAWTGVKAGSDSTTLPSAISGSTSSLQVTHTGPVNATATCTGPNSLTANVLLYGGISSWTADVVPNTGLAAVTASSSAATDMTNKNPSVGTPVQVKNIVAKMYKGTGNTLITYSSSVTTSHSIAIDKSNFTPSGVVNIPASVTANLSTSGSTAAADIYNLNFGTAYSDRTLTLTLRGLNITLNHISVNTGAAVTIGFSSGASANALPVAGTQFNETLVARDSAGNQASCTSITVSVTSGTHDAPGNSGTIPGGSGTAFKYNSTVTFANDAGAPGQFTVDLKFFKVESLTLTFTTVGSACGGGTVSVQQTYSVQAKTDTGMYARLSTDGTTAPTAHTENVICPLGAGLQMTCPTVYLHTWDTFGNYVANSTCDSWTWANYDSGSNGTSETPSLTSGAARSQSLAITTPDVAKGFLDGRLVCNRTTIATQIFRPTGTTSLDTNNATAIQTVVTGGLKGFDITTNPSGPTISSLTAANNNLTITGMTAKWRKLGSEIAKSDFVASATETLSFSTSTTSSVPTEISRTLTSGSFPIMSSTSLDCAFTSDGICRLPSNTATTQTRVMTFAIVESGARNVTLNLRGKTQSITVSAVTPAVPDSVVFQSGSAANSSPTAGTSQSEAILIKDFAGNISSCTSLSVSVQGGGTHDAPANGSTVPGTAQTFAYNSSVNVASSTPGTFAVPLTFYKAETITMNFASNTAQSGCGSVQKSFQQTYTVAAKSTSGMLARLSKDASTPATAHEESIYCPLGAGLAMNCPTLYLHVWDTFGNYISNSTCDSWTWNHYDSITGASGTSETPTLSSGNGTRSQTLTAAGTASGFMDGRIVCNKANTSISRNGTSSVDTTNTTTIQSVVVGGLKSLEITTDSTAGQSTGNAVTIATVKAAQNNVAITQIKTKVRRYGADIAKPDFVAGQTETLSLSTSSASSVTAEQQRTLASGNNPISSSTSVDCVFDSNGICKVPSNTATTQSANLNFKVVESAARTVSVALRGKSASVTVTAVTPANAANVAVGVSVSGTATTSLSVRQAFTVDATVTDTYGNRTNLKSTDGTACAIADAAATLNHTSPTSTATSLGTSAATTAPTYNSGGVYTFNIANTVVTLAGSKAVSVTACGITASSAALTFSPGALSKVVLTDSPLSTTTALSEKRCGLQSTGSGVNCPAVYAYYFDQDNNAVSGQSCTWSYAHNATAATSYGTQLTTPTLSSNGNTSTSTTVTHSDFIDGSLTCAAVSNASVTSSIALYGGIAKVELTWDAKSRDSTSGSSVTTAGGTTLTAGDANLSLNQGSGIKIKGPVKGTDTLVPDAGTALAVTFTSTAPSNGGTSPLPSNTSACNFQTTQGVCSDQTYSFNFRTAGSAYQATVSVRGKTATVGSLTVNPANAVAMVLTPKVGTNAVSSVTTDDVFDVFAQVNDTYGNATDLGSTYITCPAPSTGNTSVDTTGVVFNSNKSGATADNTLIPTSAASRVPSKVSGQVGLYKFASLQLTGIQANGSDANSTLKFALCGITTSTSGSSTTLTVKAGKPKEAFLNTSTSASRTNMGSTLCSLNASGAGATCGPIYAWLYDANQNLITSANGGQCTSWSATNIPSGSPAGLTTPTIGTSASSSQTFTSTGAFSINLTCNNTATGFTAPSVKLYGGIAQLALTWSGKTLNSSNAAVTTASASAVDAQSENLIIDSITYKTFDDTGALVTLQQGSTSEALTVSTTASAGATSVNPLAVANGNATCNMPAGVCTANSGLSNGVYKLTLNKAGEVDRSVTVSMRGIAASITGLTVNPGAMVAANRVNSISTTAVVDQPVTGGAVELYDVYNNRTQKNCTTLALAYEYSSDSGTTFATASTAAGGNTLSPDGTAPILAGTSTALSVNATVTGRYDMPTAAASALKFVKPGVYRLTPTVCGQTLATHNITVSAGAAAKVKLFASTQSDPLNATADTGPIECAHTTAGATGTAGMAISCPTINAYFFDVRGNRLSSETCTTWDFVKNANSNDSQTPSFTNSNSSSTTLTATDWIDGLLRCNKGGSAGSDLAPQLTIFGGTESISAAFSTTSPTAGNNNVTLNSITIRQRKLGSTVVVATARTNEKVVVTTTATQASTGSPSAVLTSNFTTSGSEVSYNCTSAASTGVCNAATAPVLSLTKVETTPQVTLTLRNKSVTTTFNVNAGAANSATLSLGTASPWTAGTAYTANFAPLDVFGNPTTNGCVTLTGSGGTTAPNTQSPAYGSVGTWDGTKYPITGITLYNADTTAQALTYTCNGSKSASQNITVNAASKSKVSIGSTNSKPTFANATTAAEIKCTLNSATDNTATTPLSCPTLYAWGYDTWGNATSDNTCRWQKADWATSSFGSATDLNGTNTTATYSLSATGVLNARVSCSGLTSVNTNNIYGGVSRISMILGQANTAATTSGVTTYTTTASEIQAAPSNLVISQINAYSQRESTEVGVPGIELANMNLGVAVTNVVSQSDFDLPSGQTTCTFDAATSQCSQSMTFTFKKVHTTAGTRPQITVTLKGKDAKVSVSPISAGNGATLNVTNWPASTDGNTATYTTIGTAFTASVQVLDPYGNNAKFTPNGTACSGQVVATGFDTGVYANTITTPTITAGTGAYSITANILKASTHTVTLAACGLSSQQTLRTKAGTFDRAMLTTSNTAPTAYNCTSGDVCDVTLPTCTEATRAQCGPFYVWQYDQGGNLLSTTASACGTNMANIVLSKTGDGDNIQFSGATNSSFSVQSATDGKHSSGTIQCVIGTTVTKGTRINFKAPTLVKPGFRCFPWGIDNAGVPEAACILENKTGYTLASANFKRCDASNTTDTYCNGNYDANTEALNNFSISSHCFNLVSEETGMTSGFKGHRCSIILSGLSGKKTPPMWIEGVSPDTDKVVFAKTNPSRVPDIATTTTSFTITTKTCTANTTYSYSEIAACDVSKAGSNSNTTGLYLDGVGSPTCSGGGVTYPTRRFTVTQTANGDPAKFDNTNTYYKDLDTADGVTFDSGSTITTCNQAKDVANNGTCNMRIESSRPYYEGVFAFIAGATSYVVRTGESPRCTGNNQDAN
ncbi:hypothetical protein EBU99_10175, partial [bacterium]|nr:hypothetical protein [bacterium]